MYSKFNESYGNYVELIAGSHCIIEIRLFTILGVLAFKRIYYLAIAVLLKALFILKTISALTETLGSSLVSVALRTCNK